MKKMLLTLSILMFGFTLIACDEDTGNGEDVESDVEHVEENLPEGVYGLGDTFQFEGSSGLVELTFGTDVAFTTIENEFSDLHGEHVIILPVTMTNISDETASLNMFDVTEFGTQGTSLGSVDFLVDGDDIRLGNDLRSGATLDSYYHILYDGDGEYVIEFDNWSDVTELVFEIQK